MSLQFPDFESVMRRAIELARRGEGRVEPNPMVGAVVVDLALNLLGEGWHESFGGPHAERHALEQAGARARGATLVVTLEPCCHHGKTPPCVDAVIAAGVARVIVGRVDPAPHADGRGIAALRSAGIEVEMGPLAAEASCLAAPFAKLIQTGQPYVHAKWAMSLDGKIATHTGDSKWISNESSRARAHQLRGRVDAVIIGSGTAAADDPLLTARPPGPRVAARVVVDSRASLAVDSQLVRTASESPVIVATSALPDDPNVLRLARAGVEVVTCGTLGQTHADRTSPHASVDLKSLLHELGRRKMTNVLVEGGSALLGAVLDADLVDEVHVFIAPKLIGGANAFTAVAGTGRVAVSGIPRLERPQIEILDGDVYICGGLRSGGA